jgi:hypothetical protein
VLLCGPGDDEEENLDDMLESHDGRRVGECDATWPALESPGLAGMGFGEVALGSPG